MQTNKHLVVKAIYLTLLLLPLFIQTAVTQPSTTHTQPEAVAEAVGGGEFTVEHQQHLTSQQRDNIQQQIDTAVQQLQIDQPQGVSGAAAPQLEWPLRAADPYSNEGFHAVSNFVDHDPTVPDMLLDYACGDRSYDLDTGYNHAGIDYYLWPFAWNKMDNDEVEVVAAADGVIVLKQDGNFDRSCSFGGSWNAIYIQHEDGSVAWYGHLKNGSLTAEDVGTAVSTGDYLGVVGSSGSSTIPHLHLELYDHNDELIDPYAGSCNTLNDTSWWLAQRPYYDSAINKITTGVAAVDFGTCPNPESSNEAIFFAPGDTIYFTTYYRDQLIDQTSDYTIYRPDGTTYATWSHNSNADHYDASYWYWTYTLPANAAEGKWQFEVNFNGQQHHHDFYLVAPQTPETVQYTTFADDTLDLFAYAGNNIALLLPDDDLDETAVSQLRLLLDEAYQQYEQTTGITPTPQYTHNGLATIAVVPTTCDTSCAILGQTGVELSQALFDTLYADLLAGPTFGQEPFNTLALNFWAVKPQLDYLEMENMDVVSKGVARYLAITTLNSNGNLALNPIHGDSFPAYHNEVAQLLTTYLDDDTLDWQNTLGISEVPTNTLNLETPDFFASFLFELEERFGTAFMNNLLAEAAIRPEAMATQDAVDNFVAAASFAANQNLVPLFRDEWRWPISPAAVSEIDEIFANYKYLYLPFIIN